MFTGEFMICRVRAQVALAVAAAMGMVAQIPSSAAAELPTVRLSAANAVPACATPGRLMSFLESRNNRLDDKFSTIAADYMRIGEELGIRWDTAFFQMMLETGNLKFTGDVSVSQNNFAGLGATGRKEPGESFPDVPTGVKAHLQHLLLYAGEKIDSPVAERTRKVQEWGVLDSWQKTIKSPMTFTLVAKQWAPTSRSYAREIGGISDAFYDGPCKGADPKPEMLALAKPGAAVTQVAEATTEAATAETAPATDGADLPPKISGADLARRAVEEARASGSFVRSNLGAGSLLPNADEAKPAIGEPAAGAATATAAPAVKIINAEQPAISPPPAAAADSQKPAEQAAKTAALGAGTKSSVTAAPAANAPAAPVPGCKVWTASYGGSRAIIIKARSGHLENYTVLDVNEGAEKREADAYIAAYAKGGEMVGEFTTPTRALDKAFDLCPEG